MTGTWKRFIGWRNSPRPPAQFGWVLAGYGLMVLGVAIATVLDLGFSLALVCTAPGFIFLEHRRRIQGRRIGLLGTSPGTLKRGSNWMVWAGFVVYMAAIYGLMLLIHVPGGAPWAFGFVAVMFGYDMLDRLAWSRSGLLA